jgi:hypothetical protein
MTKTLPRPSYSYLYNVGWSALRENWDGSVGGRVRGNMKLHAPDGRAAERCCKLILKKFGYTKTRILKGRTGVYGLSSRVETPIEELL